MSGLGWVVCCCLGSVLLRWCTSLYPHSGQGRPPMHGDFEAQRHWQEITLHLEAQRWYSNGSHNDLQYWGLDYPPLTAYHSLALANLADFIEPESVALFASRGYDSPSHKIFMRYTVFASDLYVYMSAVICYFFLRHNSRLKEAKKILHHKSISTIGGNAFFLPQIATLFALLYPGLILIDHGHFQYNCISLGLFVWAAAFIYIDHYVVSTVFFVLALNYKQMELYHSLPFFLYLLRKTINKPLSLIKIASTVVITFAIIWSPFLFNIECIKQILIRLFPLSRGIFEDKVSNFWCFLNVFVKLKQFEPQFLAKISLIITSLALIPSSLDLFLKPNKNKFALSLINSSLSFFLFSFQVHEKSILLVAIPVLLHLPHDPVPCVWFLTLSSFSMLPLLLKDGLIVSYISLTIIHLISFALIIKTGNHKLSILDSFNIIKVNNALKGTKNEYNSIFYKTFNVVYILSLLTMTFLSFCIVFVSPPPKYPDLFPLLISVFSFCLFSLFYLYFNYCQFIVPNKYYILYKKMA